MKVLVFPVWHIIIIYVSAFTESWKSWSSGAGFFAEFMSTALQVPIESFGGFPLEADKRIKQIKKNVEALEFKLNKGQE